MKVKQFFIGDIVQIKTHEELANEGLLSFNEFSDSVICIKSIAADMFWISLERPPLPIKIIKSLLCRLGKNYIVRLQKSNFYK